MTHAPTESLLNLRAEAAMRDEDYRIARKHAEEAGTREGTPENIRTWEGAEVWADRCLAARQEAHGRVITAAAKS